MSKILGVKFKYVGKICYFSSGNFNCKVNDYVIASNQNGESFGKIVKIIKYPSKEILKSKINEEINKLETEIQPIIRLATEKDITQYRINNEKAENARKVCMDKIKQYNLNMKIIDVEYTFDNKKILFYFSSDGKVDFRDLVKDLALSLKSRIELRQIGVRDQSKIIGGIGICGQTLCCHNFLNDFGMVAIKMAKEQGLSLNPNKISGTCGRLMCCLQYEQNCYEDLIKNSPPIGSRVKTPDGIGKIVDISLISGLLRVSLENEHNNDLLQVYHKNEVELISY